MLLRVLQNSTDAGDIITGSSDFFICLEILLRVLQTSTDAGDNIRGVSYFYGCWRYY